MNNLIPAILNSAKKYVQQAFSRLHLFVQLEKLEISTGSNQMKLDKWRNNNYIVEVSIWKI